MGADLTAVAAEAMGAPEHQFVAALHGTPGGTWMAATGDEQPGSATYGIALLSRYPVVSWRVVRLPALRAERADVVDARRNRPFSARDEPRVAVAAVLDGPFGEFTVCNTHLSFIPGWSALQLRRLVRSLDRHAGAAGRSSATSTWSSGRRRGSPGCGPLASAATFPVGRPAAAARPRPRAGRAAGDRAGGGGAPAAVGPPRARRPLRTGLTARRLASAAAAAPRCLSWPVTVQPASSSSSRRSSGWSARSSPG